MTSQIASPARQRPTASVKAAGSNQPLLLALFLLVIILPIKPLIGGQRMDPDRLYLLAVFVPFIGKMFAGKLGRVTLVDLLMMAFGTVMLITFLYHHGTPQLSFAVSQVLEVFGGYLCGRVLIRSVADYQRFIRYFVYVLLFFLPFAAYEVLTAKMFLADLFGHVFPVPEKVVEWRHGLARTQVVFAHPILYGLFCSLALASTIYINQHNKKRLIPSVLVVIAATLMSLSSAPMISVVLQVGMTLWDKLTRGSWKLLAGIFLAAILFLQFFSNRGPVIFFIENVTLDPQTGWWRIFIWQYGWENVMANPWLGIGLNDWVRPKWMHSVSVDNFWLLMAMRHGLPGLLLILSACLTHATCLIRAKGLSPAAADIRKGYTITLIGLMFTLTTVHVWDQAAVFVMFFLGAGAFIYTTPPEAEPTDDPADPAVPPDPRQPLPFSRFASGPAPTRHPIQDRPYARQSRP